MSFKDELNSVHKTPDEILTDLTNKDFEKGIYYAKEDYQNIKDRLLECAQKGNYILKNNKKHIEEYIPPMHLNQFCDVVEYVCDEIILETTIFGRPKTPGQHYAAYPKNQALYFSYISTLEKMCEPEGISIRPVLYRSGSNTFDFPVSFTSREYIFFDSHKFTLLCTVDF